MAVKKTKPRARKTESIAPAPKALRCGGKSCQIKSCKREYRAKGYCGVHYREWRHGKFGRARYKTCSDKTCRTPMAHGRYGFCEEHYQNYFVKGIEQDKAPAPEKPAAKPATKPAVAASA